MMLGGEHDFSCARSEGAGFSSARFSAVSLVTF